jgi:hypothetical protein
MAITGTWALDDIRLVVQKGYKLVVYEVYKHQVTKYNPQTGDGVLFLDYTIYSSKSKPKLVVTQIG